MQSNPRASVDTVGDLVEGRKCQSVWSELVLAESFMGRFSLRGYGRLLILRIILTPYEG